MIYGLFHPGSGVGDQIFCYLAARITAERLGVPLVMAGEFKGQSFIDLGMVIKDNNYTVEQPAGKIVVKSEWPIYEGKTYYDPEFNFIEDNTIVDGCRIQDERYFSGWPIGEWLKSEPLEVPDDLCVINFRGGEFAAIPELFLPLNYWYEGVRYFEKKYSRIRFEVHTDDIERAKSIFGNKVVHDVALNWRSVRYAKKAIIANSAFGIIPRLLSGGETIAPRRWSRPYEKDWSFAPQNYYKDFIYV